MRIWTATAAVFLITVSPVLADDIQDRQAAMDQIRVGAATLVPMLKGDKEFNADVAALALRMTYAGSIAFQGKFPEGSNSKGANPAIWQDKPDFDTKVADFKADAHHAVENLPGSLDQLKAVYEPLLQDCAACHKLYRIKDN